MAAERFELVRSIIHQCPALKMPQTYIQRIGMVAQIVPLPGLTEDQAQAIVDQLNAGVALPANTFRQGNWSHPDGDGSRIIGWRIPKADVERMGADAYVLPQEVSDALARLSAAHGVAAPALNDEQLADLVPQSALVLEKDGERNMVCMTRAQLHEFAQAVRAAGVDLPDGAKR